MNRPSVGRASHQYPVYEIRAARPDEAGAFSDVWYAAESARRNLCESTFTEAERADTNELIEERWCVRGAVFLVALRAGQVRGIVHALPARDRDGAGDEIPGLLHVSMLAVEPEYWGRGLGRALLRSCVEGATMLGYRAAQLWTDVSNRRAQRLYDRMGFERTGREKTDSYLRHICLYTLDLAPATKTGRSE